MYFKDCASGCILFIAKCMGGRCVCACVCESVCICMCVCVCVCVCVPLYLGLDIMSIDGLIRRTHWPSLRTVCPSHLPTQHLAEIQE